MPDMAHIQAQRLLDALGGGADQWLVRELAREFRAITTEGETDAAR